MDFPRDPGLHNGRLARAYAAAGNPEQAVVAATIALATAQQTASARIMTELKPLPPVLSEWTQVQPVQLFTSQLRRELASSAEPIGNPPNEGNQ